MKNVSNIYYIIVYNKTVCYSGIAISIATSGIYALSVKRNLHICIKIWSVIVKFPQFCCCNLKNNFHYTQYVHVFP